MFNDEAVNEIFDKIISYAMTTGRFDFVNQHEPTNAPHRGLQFSIWIQRIRPIDQSSIKTTSGLVLFSGRIYKNFKSHPHDLIDPDITSAIADMMNVLSGDFDFGGTANVRALDLMGMTGERLEAIAGYLELDRQMFRVMTLNIPVIVNDMFVHGSSNV
jgi:hypothetical protein